MSKQATPPPPGDKPNPSAPPKPPTWRNWIWPVMLVVIFALWFFLPTRIASTNLSYSQFVDDVQSSQVKTVQLATTAGGTTTGTLKDGKNFTVVIPVVSQELVNQLDSKGVQVTAAPASNGFGTEVLIYLITFGLPILLFVWFFRRLSKGAGAGIQGALGVGRSRAKVFDEERPSTTFADVAGYEGAKSEIAEVVDFLKQARPVHQGRRAGAPRRADGRPARHRQDAAGPRRGGRGRRAVLLGHRVQLRGAVRRRRRVPRPRPVRSRPASGPRPSSSSTRSTPSASAGPAAAPWCPTTSASRPSTSCWPRWTGSTRRPAWWCSPPPTGPRSSTRPCCAPAASTARSRSRCRTWPNAPPSSPSTSATSSWRPTSTSTWSPAAPPASPAPTWPTWSTRPPSSPSATTGTTITAEDFDAARDRILLGRREGSNALLPGGEARGGRPRVRSRPGRGAVPSTPTRWPR